MTMEAATFRLGDRVEVPETGPGWIVAQTDEDLAVELEDPAFPDSGPFVGHAGTVWAARDEVTLIKPAAADVCGVCLVSQSEVTSCGHPCCPKYSPGHLVDDAGRCAGCWSHPVVGSPS
jgi:hypothetical protein